jgi:HD superfamily phosphohydrolase
MLGHLCLPVRVLPLPLRSHYNRLRRGVLAFVPSLIQCDDQLAQERLIPAEYGLFQQMDVRDKQHALWVALALLEHDPLASDTLVAAALLHDIGKCEAPFHALERIAVHLLAVPFSTTFSTPLIPPAYPKLSGWRGAWQRKCHHERYGAERINQAGGRARVAAIIAACHADTCDPEVCLLSRVDACF